MTSLSAPFLKTKTVTSDDRDRCDVSEESADGDGEDSDREKLSEPVVKESEREIEFY